MKKEYIEKIIVPPLVNLRKDIKESLIILFEKIVIISIVDGLMLMFTNMKLF